jgi:hypothetical protein
MNKGVFEEYPKYKNMSCKMLNKKEMKLFMSVLDQYNQAVSNKYGIVWENKKLGLDKDLVLNTVI